MRLINTSRLELQEFLVDVPPYAILSHTWTDDEVLFQDFASTRDAKPPKAGWEKILAACDLAATLEHDWLWIDTCCIDKTSSAELSEAINSMFRWYRGASLCIAYLADVPSWPETYVTGSRWFTRGWTLQELLAPFYLDFYSADWVRLGSRADFADAIEEKTHIDARFLRDRSASLSTASVAERMCWASGRETTRPEDQAYSLLGIFDVNIPLIYGEGARAFKRLQEAILRENDDQSIFAWGAAPVEGWPPVLSASETDRPLLADSPARFAGSGDIVPFPTPGLRAGMRLEHDGIVVSTPLWRPGHSAHVAGRDRRTDVALFLAPLRCRRKKDFFDCIAICLRGEEADRDLGRGAEPWDSMSCFRMCGDLFLTPRTAWRADNLCETFVHFEPRPILYSTVGGSGDAEEFLDRGCVIRSLPPTYAATEAYSAPAGLRAMPVLFPYTRRIPGAHGLAAPVVVRLRAGPGWEGWQSWAGWRAHRHEPGRREADLALVLQFQYLSVEVDGRAQFPSRPEWMENRVVRVPEGGTLEDVAELVVEESRLLGAAIGVDGEDGGGVAAVRRFPPAVGLSSKLDTFGGFRLSVTVEPAFGSGVFVVDVADSEGRGVSRAASALEDAYEPVRG